MLRFLLGLSIVAASLTEMAQAQTEADYRERLCADMRTEVRLSDGTRADCISKTHAIEIDFSQKWAEAIGQALNYAKETALHPGIILICKAGTRESTCLGHALHVEEILAALNRESRYWRCPADAMTLGDCFSRDFH